MNGNIFWSNCHHISSRAINMKHGTSIIRHYHIWSFNASFKHLFLSMSTSNDFRRTGRSISYYLRTNKKVRATWSHKKYRKWKNKQKFHPWNKNYHDWGTSFSFPSPGWLSSMGPQAEMEGAPPVLIALLMVSSKVCGFPDCTKSQACQVAVTWDRWQVPKCETQKTLGIQLTGFQHPMHLKTNFVN